MDKKTLQQSISQARAIAYLSEMGWWVFADLTGKAPIDFLALDTNLDPKKVEVKSCFTKNRHGTYSVQLGRVRSNKTENIVYKFDENSCDILLVVLPDRIEMIDPKEVNGQRTVNFKP